LGSVLISEPPKRRSKLGIGALGLLLALVILVCVVAAKHEPFKADIAGWQVLANYDEIGNIRGLGVNSNNVVNESSLVMLRNGSEAILHASVENRVSTFTRWWIGDAGRWWYDIFLHLLLTDCHPYSELLRFVGKQGNPQGIWLDFFAQLCLSFRGLPKMGIAFPRGDERLCKYGYVISHRSAHVGETKCSVEAQVSVVPESNSRPSLRYSLYPRSIGSFKLSIGSIGSFCHLAGLITSNSSVDYGCYYRVSRPLSYPFLSAIIILLVFVCLLAVGDRNWNIFLGSFIFIACFLCGMCGFGILFYCGVQLIDGVVECSKLDTQIYDSHTHNTVPHKYPLTIANYWGTVIGIGRAQMPNILPMEKKVAVISALAEGSGIRQIERITGVHRDTIMRLGVRVGQGCAELLDSKMRALPCHHLQFDEVWGFIGKKERHLRPEDDPRLGDVWTFCAIDPDTKLVPSFKVGKRNTATANAFVADVASRMANRVQISSDALREYVDAIEMSFGGDVDFAQIIKTYTHDDSIIAERKFSAPEVVTTEKRRVCGHPNMHLASTSHIERLNGTTRLHMRRLTRLTYAFSKKLENFEAATALHFAYYNFVKRHNTLRATPAMAAGIERDFWTVRGLVEAA
jgi:IS1 family transposase